MAKSGLSNRAGKRRRNERKGGGRGEEGGEEEGGGGEAGVPLPSISAERWLRIRLQILKKTEHMETSNQ